MTPPAKQAHINCPAHSQRLSSPCYNRRRRPRAAAQYSRSATAIAVAMFTPAKQAHINCPTHSQRLSSPCYNRRRRPRAAAQCNRSATATAVAMSLPTKQAHINCPTHSQRLSSPCYHRRRRPQPQRNATVARPRQRLQCLYRPNRRTSTAPRTHNDSRRCASIAADDREPPRNTALAQPR
jgi:hypothetical protein